jgi:hypothetical protein
MIAAQLACTAPGQCHRGVIWSGFRHAVQLRHNAVQRRAGAHEVVREVHSSIEEEALRSRHGIARRSNGDQTHRVYSTEGELAVTEPRIAKVAPITNAWPKRVLTGHVSDDARLYANRFDLLKSVSLPAGAAVAEIGVAIGSLSQFFFDNFDLGRFDAFDLFELHKLEALWGQPTQEIFGSGAHLDWYKDLLNRSAPNVDKNFYVGDSATNLATVEPATYDLVYVDGDHRYEGVKRDAEQALRVVKPSGIIVFNDYTFFDPITVSEYGIVQVVNEIVNETNWVITKFALDVGMFCDIALCFNSIVR